MFKLHTLLIDLKMCCYYYYYYAVFNAPCVDHKDDESQAQMNTLPAERMTSHLLLHLNGRSSTLTYR